MGILAAERDIRDQISVIRKEKRKKYKSGRVLGK
jgi:hypothetical protein